jgi:hypothetical protein
MLIRLKSAICSAAGPFEMDDVVDWKDQDGKGDTIARELVKKQLAEPVEQKELAPGQKIKKYIEPAPKLEDMWPPPPQPRRKKSA